MVRFFFRWYSLILSQLLERYLYVLSPISFKYLQSLKADYYLYNVDSYSKSYTKNARLSLFVYHYLYLLSPLSMYYLLSLCTISYLYVFNRVSSVETEFAPLWYASVTFLEALSVNERLFDGYTYKADLIPDIPHKKLIRYTVQYIYSSNIYSYDTRYNMSTNQISKVR